MNGQILHITYCDGGKMMEINWMEESGRIVGYSGLETRKFKLMSNTHK
jgi:hypothetical protein